MNRIKELRLQNCIKQIDLANQIGVSQAALSGYENSKYEPDIRTLNKLASIFDVSIDFLLKRSPSHESGITRVPVLGSIPAGIPIEAIEDIEDWEELPADMARNGYEYFALRVQGDSMTPEYRDGDVAIFRKQESCESGNDCAVLVNGDDAVFKRVKIAENGITLMPLNPIYDPCFYSNSNVEELPVQILGVAIQIRRDL